MVHSVTSNGCSEEDSSAFCYSFETIRLGLFDLGGVLYHAHYFALFEEMRESFLRSIKLPYSRMVEENKHFAVRSSSLAFKKPIRYGQQIRGELRAARVKSSSFSFHYCLFDSQSEELLHTAETAHVFVQASPGASPAFTIRQLPDELRDALSRITDSGAQ